MKKVNFHTHSELCLHADGTEADYVQAARDAGLEVLGLSDHAPFPDGRFDMRMQYGELDGHLARIARLREKNAGKLRILTGLEIEYCRDMTDYYHELLTQRGLDYLLLGQHYYQEEDGSYIHVFSIPKRIGTAGYVKYALSAKSALETGLFPILAHPDVIFSNDFPWDENCSLACDILIEAARRTGTVLELNANGIRKGLRRLGGQLRYPYPHPEFWRRVSVAQLPVLVGSDCHSPAFLWDDCVKEAYRLGREWELRFVDSFGK
ncbi:MAG: histidinol-phosphatase [Eubacteriales bacterium]|nr:histidinol-phosphatase [Eubacteriales bacterium]